MVLTQETPKPKLGRIYKTDLRLLWAFEALAFMGFYTPYPGLMCLGIVLLLGYVFLYVRSLHVYVFQFLTFKMFCQGIDTNRHYKMEFLMYPLWLALSTTCTVLCARLYVKVREQIARKRAEAEKATEQAAYVA